MTTDKELWERLFIAREMQNYHAPYNREFGFYDAVSLVNIKKLRESYLDLPIYDI